MSSEQVRADADWLALREPADAESRAGDLVEDVLDELRTAGNLRIHDLGSGTGSMLRWLAPRLPGPQHWVLHDRDARLLAVVRNRPPATAADGTAITVETRRHDITRLGPEELAGASLITASALLDMMTRPELDRFVAGCARPGCAVLVALTVTGEVSLDPPDPLDDRVAAAFNEHQRRPSGSDNRLGPDALGAAVDLWAGHDRSVVGRASPWRLGAERRDLRDAWFTDWLRAAAEQDPDLVARTRAYARRRLAGSATDTWSVTVGHQDLLVRARPAGTT